MMSDWAVLHLDGDPAPGDPGQVRTLATRLLTDAELAERNTQRLRTISANDSELRMEGDYAPRFRQVLGELPGELSKLSRAYRGCGEALSSFAGSLEHAQGQAASALRQGRDAEGGYQGAIRQVQSLLPPDRHGALSGRQALNASTLDASTADLDAGLRAEIQSAAARGRAAEADRARARRLAEEAAKLRGEAETRCANGIRSALEGIKNKEWYEKAWNWATKPFRSWDEFIKLCRNVALIAGVVALFVSGPIGLALLAVAWIATAIVFKDTLDRYRRGKASLADVGSDALDLVPGSRGVKGARELAAAVRRAGRRLTQKDGSKIFSGSIGWYPGVLRQAPPGTSNAIARSPARPFPREFLDQAKKYGQAGVRELPDGRFRFYGEISEARTAGEMAGRRLVREWNPDTGSTRIWHETVDHSGNVRIVRPDVSATGGEKVHYRFDINGNFVEKW